MISQFIVCNIRSITSHLICNADAMPGVQTHTPGTFCTPSKGRLSSCISAPSSNPPASPALPLPTCQPASSTCLQAMALQPHLELSGGEGHSHTWQRCLRPVVTRVHCLGQQGGQSLHAVTQVHLRPQQAAGQEPGKQPPAKVTARNNFFEKLKRNRASSFAGDEYQLVMPPAHHRTSACHGVHAGIVISMLVCCAQNCPKPT